MVWADGKKSCDGLLKGEKDGLFLQKRQKLPTYGAPNFLSSINSRGCNYDYPFSYTDEHFNTRKEASFLKGIFRHVSLLYLQNNSDLRVFLCDYTFYH